MAEFTDDAARRIAATVRRDEADGRTPGRTPARQPGLDKTPLVNVTGPATDAGEYPGRLAWWDAAAAAYTYSDPVRFRPAGADTPATDGSGYYLARYVGSAADPTYGLYLGQSGGGGTLVRFARVTEAMDDAGQPVPDLYDFVEIETYQDTDGVYKDRDKAGGVSGRGRRKRSEAAAGVPPIRAGQTVVFTPGAVPDLYDLTPWGSHHTPVVEQLVRVTVEATVADDGSTVYAAPNFFRRVGDGARERCLSQAPVGATPSPLGGP